MKGYEIFQDVHHMYCVYEYLAGGNLAALRSNAEKAGVELTEEYFQTVFIQCLKGLKELHQHAILHCDIKEPNIMIRNTCYKHPQCVLIDVGLSVHMVGEGESGGTPGYRPPEVCESSIWSPKGDVFSMGVVFFQLMADMVPDKFGRKRGVFQRNTKRAARNVKDIVEFTKKRMLPTGDIKKRYPGFDDTWLLKMVDKNRDNRPSPAKLLEDAWFQVDIPHCREGCPIRPPPRSRAGECVAACSLM